MTTDLHDQHDADLRALVSAIDPARDTLAPDPRLLARAVAQATRDAAPAGATRDAAPAGAGPSGSGPSGSGPSGSSPRGLRRHWQPALLAAAALASLALASGTLLGGGSSADVSSAPAASGSSAPGAAPPDLGTGARAVPEGAVPEGAVPGGTASEGAASDSSKSGAATSVAPGTAAVPRGNDSTAAQADPALVRSASLLVGTDDQQGARDQFAATVERLGGRITYESVIQSGSAIPDAAVSSDMARPQGAGWPWYPTGPGIWLAAQVPAERFDEAVRAARAAGVVVQLQQSSYDVSDQVTDVRARIDALEASLTRLTALMDDAKGISEIVALEQAIAQRQSELDSLRAQQRNLADQTQMSQINLTLMSPQDARATVDPDDGGTWWDSLLDGLAQVWAWLGRALFVASPLLVALAIIWWVRRRATRRATASAAAQPVRTRGAEPPGAQPAAADRTAAGPIGSEPAGGSRGDRSPSGSGTAAE